MPAPNHSFFTGRMPFLLPNHSVKALKASTVNQQMFLKIQQQKAVANRQADKTQNVHKPLNV